MKKVCKMRFYPNKSQIELINETLGCCRYVSNMYISYNQKMYKDGYSFISGYEFSRIINKMKKTDPNSMWMTKYSSKAIKDAIMTTETGLKKFFKKNVGFPHFKSRKRMKKESFFFIKDSIKFDTGSKNIIKIPILGKVRITERNYLPDKKFVTSGRVIKDGKKYYLMFIYDGEICQINHSDYRIGIDVGVKNYATIASSNGDVITVNHFKDWEHVKALEAKKIKLQQVLSHKVEVNYYRKLNSYMDKHKGESPCEKTKNIMKGESYNTSGVRRLCMKINRIEKKLANIRKDFICKLVDRIVVKTKPKCITIEDLSISNMLQNGTHDLHKYITFSGFYYFRMKLTELCKKYQTELRIAGRYFASSKKCSECGYKLKNLKLSDRIFKCPNCGLIIDRDENASINLVRTKKYTVEFA